MKHAGNGPASPGPAGEKEGFMGSTGKAGCGCIIGILVVVMVLAGVLMHPMSLKFMAKQFRYEDKIVPADALFVPRFAEDKKGDLYTEAFREYFAGNGKAVYIEDDKILGTNITEFVSRMAKARGVKENIIKGIDPGPDGTAGTNALKEKLKASGVKKVIVVVPEYASRRYHYIYDSSRSGDAVFYMIKPVQVTYFQRDKWWRDCLSRSLMAREFYASLSHYSSMLWKKESGKQ